MKILSIGNSFSTDAQRYLNRISRLNSCQIKSVNLYIGGCPLRRHYFNVLENEKAYDFQFNGESTGLLVSIKDALKSDAWDYVTLQQASTYSPIWESYEPYLETIAEYVKKYAPQAKLVVHKTWAYSAEHIVNKGMAGTREDMYNALSVCYDKMAQAIDTALMIPSGDVVEALIRNGITAPHRDGYHLSLGAGRLAVALLWYSLFSGEDPYEVNLPALDVPTTDEEIAIVRKSVAEVLKK